MKSKLPLQTFQHSHDRNVIDWFCLMLALGLSSDYVITNAPSVASHLKSISQHTFITSK